ncbi:unnamed protein product, partial [Meganyctiphanes norvegica]
NSSHVNNNLLMEKLKLAHDIVGDNRLLILGDFNVPKIDWTNMNLLQGASRVERQILETTNDCFLYQHVRENTRYRNMQSSLLDLIFTREEGDVKNIEVLCPLGKSDHGIVTGDFVSEWKTRAEPKPRRMYHKGNYEKIIEELNQIDWKAAFEGKSEQEAWDIFKRELEVLVDKYVPLASPRDYNEPWMNKPIMKLWKKKYNAWKRYTDRKGHYRYEEYKRE